METPSKNPSYRYRFVLEYDGSFFSGWQWQPSAPSVQDALQQAAFCLTQEKVLFFGAGRTDKGVHAWGQVAHCDFHSSWSEDNLRRGLNFYLAPSIRVLSVYPVLLDFHARFSALYRQYVYLILNRASPSALESTRYWWIQKPLDIPAMEEASALFCGTHDFSRFRHRNCQGTSPMKTLDLFSVQKEGNQVRIQVQARSFLHGQVRRMVGALVYVGHGKGTAAYIRGLLSLDALSLALTAPAHGLYLAQVGYPAASS